MPRFLVVYESAVGLSLFDCGNLNEVKLVAPEYRKQIDEFNLFAKMVHLEFYMPFDSAMSAADTQTMISEGKMSQFYETFLNSAISQCSTKYDKFTLGISDRNLASEINGAFGYSCISDNNTHELMRGIRQHFDKFIEELSENDILTAQLGVAHAYSRAKVKFNQHGDDNMIISSITLLKTLDNDLNTFSMRLREWYHDYFPELSNLIDDHALYAKTIQLIGDRNKIDRDLLLKALKDEDLVDNIVLAANNSSGQEITEIDRLAIISFAKRVESLAKYHENLLVYLRERTFNISPNLTSLISERKTAELIAASGSLTNLAKAPSSTVQLLGAEKALFNALKKRKPTPKYGLIYSSAPVMAKSTPKEKGRIARTLANKISIAARIDAFGDDFRGGHLGLILNEMMESKIKEGKKSKNNKPNYEMMIEAVKKARKLEESDPNFANRKSEQIDVQIKSKPLTDEPEKPKRRRRKHRHNDEEQKEEQKVEEPEQIEQNVEQNDDKSKKKKRRRSETKEVEEQKVEKVEQIEQNDEQNDDKSKKKKRRRSETKEVEEQKVEEVEEVEEKPKRKRKSKKIN